MRSARPGPVPVIATAGHVDHGKSTLVRALTGIDPDRLEEEKARGLTIDLGFAWRTQGGREVAFIDVPGHVRFIKNMLAGVGAVDACLFVVAAPESWKPQSEEHLRILELLGVRHGIIALTKAAALDDDVLDLARLEVAEMVKGTFLERAEMVAVDAPAGRGLYELESALERLLASTPEAPDTDRPRLWIDRSFSAHGSGTVVTGTLTGGTLVVGDELIVVGPGPRAARPPLVRVRRLQSHKQGRDSLEPGRRAAVNVTGLPHNRLRRGDALVRMRQWAPTRTADCSLHVLASLGHDVGRRGAYHAYIGAGEHAVRLRLLGAASSIPPGGAGWVRMHLPAALPLLPGDRYVLREAGRSETVGGGEILDVSPVLPASRARPSRSLQRVVSEREWTDADLLERLTGETVEANVGSWVVSHEVLSRAVSEVRASIDKAGHNGLDLSRLDERLRPVAGMAEGVSIRGGRAYSGSAPFEDSPPEAHPYVAALASSPFNPPAPSGVDRLELRQLLKEGAVVEREGVYFAASAVEEARRVVAHLLQNRPEGVTVAAVREALGTTRKYVLPLLSHMDATGMTRRRGDLRVAGPKLGAGA